MTKLKEKLKVIFGILIVSICFNILYSADIVDSANMIKAKTINLNINQATINIGGVITLQAKLDPINSTNTIKWSSKDKSIVSVNSEGVVTGISEGKTTIIAKTSNGKSAICTIIVKSELTKLDVKKLIDDNVINEEEINKLIERYTFTKEEIERLVNSRTSNTNIITKSISQNEFDSMLQYYQNDTNKTVLTYPNKAFEWVTTDINGTVTGSAITVNISNISVDLQYNDFNQTAASTEKNKMFTKYKYIINCQGNLDKQNAGDELYLQFQPISNGVQLSYIVGELVEIKNDGSFNFQCVTDSNSTITEVVFNGIDYFTNEYLQNQ